jgi:glycolate oxidase iron-sulfur subunit
MQTHLLADILATSEGREAEAILRTCVHCGFCTATCPTYQLLGDELDGPRGRIYQIKSVLEGQTPTRVTQGHLDRCLTCRACETTCPSGVRYARLADIGRDLVERRVPRPLFERLVRRALLLVVPHPARLRVLLRLVQWFKPLLPARLRSKVPRPQAAMFRQTTRGGRRMLVLAGCVQSVATPRTNDAASRVLSRLGIELIESAGAGCCGALAYHLGDRQAAFVAMRRNIDAWWTEIESGCEAILVTASGCASMVKDYGELLADDPDYAAKAARVSALTRDPAEILVCDDLSVLGSPGGGRRVAFHAPCSLQHGQRIRQVVEPMLTRLGFVTTAIADAHLCCGSAGSYSLLQPGIAEQLRASKLAALESDGPELIATANIGCQLHLAAGTRLPVVHWLELLDIDARTPGTG